MEVGWILVIVIEVDVVFFKPSSALGCVAVMLNIVRMGGVDLMLGFGFGLGWRLTSFLGMLS